MPGSFSTLCGGHAVWSFLAYVGICSLQPRLAFGPAGLDVVDQAERAAVEHTDQGYTEQGRSAARAGQSHTQPGVCLFV